MAKQSEPQKRTVERVMHEYKHGELESGSGRKVRKRRQAVAIALSEAGASDQESPRENRRNFRRTKAKERRGETARARRRRAKRRSDARSASGPSRSSMPRRAAGRFPAARKCRKRSSKPRCGIDAAPSPQHIQFYGDDPFSVPPSAFQVRGRHGPMKISGNSGRCPQEPEGVSREGPSEWMRSADGPFRRAFRYPLHGGVACAI